MVYIQEAISKIEAEHLRQVKLTIPKSLMNQLVVQATYDPSMFFNPDGSVAFNEWDEIPEEYRCCVEGIETKAYGRDGTTLLTTIKLVDREKARKYLLKVCPGLLEAEKMEIIHKTIDEQGNPVGIDLKKLSDEEILARVQKIKERENR